MTLGGCSTPFCSTVYVQCVMQMRIPRTLLFVDVSVLLICTVPSTWSHISIIIQYMYIYIYICVCARVFMQRISKNVYICVYIYTPISPVVNWWASKYYGSATPPNWRSGHGWSITQLRQARVTTDKLQGLWLQKQTSSVQVWFKFRNRKDVDHFWPWVLWN